MSPDTQKSARSVASKGSGDPSIRAVVVLALAAIGLTGCPERAEQKPTLPPGPAETVPKVESKAGTGVRPQTTALTDEQRGRAKTLYNRHCAGCHGEKGDGKSVAARYLFPKPRDFRAGHFRLVSTSNGVPTIEDIGAVLARGMPGSAMPPWRQLSEADRKLLAQQVMEFRRTGIRDQEVALAKEDGEEIDEEEVNQLIQELTTPGPGIEVPEIPASTPEAVARGKELYLSKGCDKCHGKEGKGDGTGEMFNVEGWPNLPRDLTQGIFKGSPDPKSVYIRTQAGMPGSAMPVTTDIKPEEIIDLVHYALSLSDAATRAETVLNREKIVARKVETAPDSPVDESWGKVKPLRLRLTPLRWRNERVEAVEVRAVHDGSKLSLHLSWDDASLNGRAVRVEEFSDGAAVQFSPSTDPPFFGMGAKDALVNTWYWKADHAASGDAVAGIESAFPNMIAAFYPFQNPPAVGVFRTGGKIAQQDRTYVAGWGSGNPVSNPRAKTPVENLNAGGPGTLRGGSHVRALVAGRGVWKSGRWQVVMSRPLEAKEPQDVSFKPGETLSVTFAVWEGSAGDRDGQKNVSVWHELTLEK